MVAFVLQGCGGMLNEYKTEQRPLFKDATQEIKQQDVAYCTSEKMKINTPDYEYSGTFLAGANIKQKQGKYYELCLKGRGWK